MFRPLVPVLVAALVVLSGCSLAPDSVSSGGDPSQVQEPASSGQEAPGEGEPSGSGEQSNGEEPAAPPVVWYPKDIGMPLTTDDPAHQEDKVVLLTFDDGPSDTDSTAQILDVLKEKQVKAIFFVTGYGVRDREDMLKRIADEGHVIGLHTMTHPDLASLTPEEMREELVPLMEKIEAVTGQRPKYLRPPFGSYNDEVLSVAAELGLQVVTWTSGSLDWEGNDANGYKDPAVVVRDVMDQLFPGAVYLFHDTKTHTAEALPEIIDLMRAEGYEFVVLS